MLLLPPLLLLMNQGARSAGDSGELRTTANHGDGGIGGQEECCETKYVTGRPDKAGTYRLIKDMSTGDMPSICMNGCLYTKDEDSEDTRYCFKHSSSEYSAACAASAAPSDPSTAAPAAAAAAAAAAQAEALLGLLAPVPAQGASWPRIRGPGIHDRVCVVGAGPAGVHMALSLKQRNYTRVVVLERTGRAGGKSLDIDYRGVPNPQGSIFLVASYYDNLVALAREYGLGEVVKIPTADVWATNSASDQGSKITYAEFFVGSLSKLTNSSSPQVNLGAFLEATVRYIKLHQGLFGSYEGILMQKPGIEELDRIRGTFMDFLTREALIALVPLFRVSHTVQGYGHLDEVSAMYGMIWNTPQFLVNMALRALKQDKDPYSTYVMKNGYEKIWTTIIEKEKLDVRYNTDIVGVGQGANATDLHIWRNSRVETEKCAFLVWTPPMSELLRVLAQPSPSEVELFSGLRHEIFTSNLVNMEGAARNGPYTAFMTNVLGKVDHGVLVDVDMAGLLTPGMRNPEVLARYNKGTGLQTKSCQQIGKETRGRAELRQILKEHYKGFHAQNLDILHTRSWNYFPRWSPEETALARHWQVFGIQGLRSIWYAGSSVSFESVPAVMEYNRLLLRQMDPPTQ